MKEKEHLPVEKITDDVWEKMSDEEKTQWWKDEAFNDFKSEYPHRKFYSFERKTFDRGFLAGYLWHLNQIFKDGKQNE